MAAFGVCVLATMPSPAAAVSLSSLAEAVASRAPSGRFAQPADLRRHGEPPRGRDPVVRRYTRADADDDGIPCETVCGSLEEVDAIRAEIGC